MDQSKVKHLDSIQEEKRPRLENWYRGHSLKGNIILFGDVYDRPPFVDGEFIHTSRLVWMTDTQAQTKNTLYDLGKPLAV